MHPFGLWALHAALALAPVKVRGVLLARGPDPDADNGALMGATEDGSETVAKASISGDSRVEEDMYMSPSLGAVPDVSLFEEKWRKFSKMDEDHLAQKLLKRKSQTLEEPPDINMRMVLGVFATLDSSSAPYMDVIRRTWFNQTIVCPAEDVFKMDTPCKIFVTFVVGRNSIAGVLSTNQTDVTVLSLEENMNCGKTRYWFEYAANKYRQATHIGKMDIDAFVHLKKLVDTMQEFATINSCKQHFGGRPWHCHEPEYCPPEDCWYPTGTDFFKYEIDNPDCWSYMQGGFYFLSRDVTSHIAMTGGWWSKNWWSKEGKYCLPEDALVGKAVMHYATARKMCVGVVNLRGKGVVWHPDFFNYWKNEGHPEYSQPASTME